MRTLRDLLTTWENWSARDVSRRALANTVDERQRAVLRDALDQGDEVNPLDVLRDVTELVSLVGGWRWQAMGAAREADASWEEIGAAVRLDAEQAHGEYLQALRLQAHYRIDRVEQ